MADRSEHGISHRTSRWCLFRCLPNGMVWTEEDLRSLCYLYYWFCFHPVLRAVPPGVAGWRAAWWPCSGQLCSHCPCLRLRSVPVGAQRCTHIVSPLVGEGTHVLRRAGCSCSVTKFNRLTAFHSCTNICFVTGQLIANGVIAGTHNIDSHWAYSAPFAVQWVWPLVILAGLPFAPER